MFGPADPLRSASSGRLLPAALAAGAQAGVTRLADVTRLDRLGLPVWQAVRPLSRALSVHQGKGASHDDARLGALLEAVESHAAESFDGPSISCAFEDLPGSERAPHLSDFASRRDSPPSAAQPLRWVEAQRLAGGGAIHWPFDLVSLDFTRASPSRIDRSSNGVATGVTEAEAVLVALHELIERDSMAEWRALDMVERTGCALDPRSVPYAWFGELVDRIERAGAGLACFLLPSLTGTPVFACEINDPTKAALPFRAANGRGAHPIAEIALFRAVSEAIQSRAAYIAGARDDLAPTSYARREGAITMAFALPPPPGVQRVAFAGIADGPQRVEQLLAALGRAGFPDAAMIRLASNHGFHVVRVFVCGLGSTTRRRRPS